MSNVIELPERKLLTTGQRCPKCRSSNLEERLRNRASCLNCEWVGMRQHLLDPLLHKSLFTEEASAVITQAANTVKADNRIEFCDAVGKDLIGFFQAHKTTNVEALLIVAGAMEDILNMQYIERKEANA